MRWKFVLKLLIMNQGLSCQNLHLSMNWSLFEKLAKQYCRVSAHQFNWNKYTSNNFWFHYWLNSYLIFYLVFPKESLSCPE